jgi:hypothetical protein
MAAIPSFKYVPLPLPTSIRLVVLEQASGQEPIRCKLISVESSKKPTYEALSYEWGPTSNRNWPIYINGAWYEVRKNLYDALVYLRSPDTGRTLWIDALCINQEDVIERNQQVYLMGSIYSQAREVLVWLGPEKDNSDLAMDLFEEMSQYTLKGGIKGALLQKMGRWIYLRGRKTESLGMDELEPELRAILAWTERTFWKRIWIVQEIQLAQKLSICCGSKLLSDKTLTNARSYMDMQYPPQLQDPHHLHADLVKKISESQAFKLLELRDSSHHQQPTISLKDWLYICKHSNCTDLRDRVYALLGLASDCRNNELVADYSKSVAQVCTDVLKMYSQQGLSGANLVTFSQFLHEELKTTPQNPNPSSITATELSATDDSQIWVPCMFAGKITYKGGPFKRWLLRGDELHPMNVVDASVSGPAYTFRDTSLDIVLSDKKFAIMTSGFLFPKIRDVEVGDMPNVAPPPFLGIKHTMSWTRRQEMPKLPRSQPNNEMVHWFHARPSTAHSELEHECTPPTEAQYLGFSGFAPSNSRIGDVTCTFPGSDVVLILREDNFSWKLIGRAISVNAYCMSGPAIANMWRGDPKKLRTVAFRSVHAAHLRIDLDSLMRLTTQ